ncbi:Arc family DNA-binding protein [Neorhizobium turbinariae]|uniref:Arc family DNA-binding protein n=1 Tax=Neorhizobium turbinariae TaxID=2937795 RepID=UPI0028BE16FB|nr:Arc family DNA-binding protein [Neorhizobium turbinariae]
MVKKSQQPKLMVRLPDDVKTFISSRAEYNGSSQNSEVIRCIRAQMEAASVGNTGRHD